MSDCVATLRAAMTENFLFYLEAHFFHWNVEGPTFSQLHDLFGRIYEDADNAMDGLAEHIRTLGEYAPATPDQLMGGGKIVIAEIRDAAGMVAKLASDNELVKGALETAMEAAEEEGYSGLSNYLQERIDQHAKWGWMLKATSETGSDRQKRKQNALYGSKRQMNS